MRPCKVSTCFLDTALLQSALEEREREIHKMLMERELEKAEKLKGLETSVRVIKRINMILKNCF